MAQKISQMTEQTTSSMTEAGTSDFLGGYTATGGNANRKFSLSGLANYFLNKFKMTLGGSSQTVKSAIDALNSKTLVTFTPETGVRVVENNLVRVGNVVVGNLWLEVTASEKTAKNSTLGSFSQYSLLSFRANANIVDTTKTARGSFKVTSNSNVLVVDNNYALPELGAYNITFCFCTKD